MAKITNWDDITKLPTNTMAESTVLGCCLLGGKDVYEKAKGWIREENAFYSEEHKKVLKRLSQARSRNKFWDSRCKSRPNFNSDPHIPKRIAQFSKANELISYIIERNLRKS